MSYKCDSQYIVNLTEEKSAKLQSNTVGVPCGKCYNCKRRRIAQWSIRLMKELEVSTSAYFLTLTYDGLHVPISQNGFLTLCKNKQQNEELNHEKQKYTGSDRSIQAFFKRLRYYEEEYRFLYERKTKRIITKKPLKYYTAGEYGTLNNRPHYHSIIFNLSSPSSIDKAWATAVVENGVTIDWIPFGTYDLDSDVNQNNIDYTLKYICKDGWNRKHKNDDRQREFSLNSKGLGKNFLTPDISSFYNKRLDINYTVNAKGHKVPLPRYYRDKLMTEETRENAMQIIKIQMDAKQLKDEEDAKRKGIDYDKQQQQRKFARQQLMKNYSKRNID